MAATIIISVAAYYASRPELPKVELTHIHFDHTNRTYTANQNISILTKAALAHRGLSVDLTAILTVKDANGKEVYRDKIAGGRLFISVARRKRVYEHTAKIRSTFRIEEIGEYEVWVTAYVGEQHDTTGDTMKVVR